MCRIAHLMQCDIKYAYDHIMAKEEKKGYTFEQLENYLISKL